MKWKVTRIVHRSEKRIALSFGFDAQLKEAILLFKDARWSQTLKCWHIPDTQENRQQLKIDPIGLETDQVENAIAPIENSPLLKSQILYVEPSKENISISEEVKTKLIYYHYWLKSKRYSDQTIKVYLQALEAFLKFYVNKPLQLINNHDIIIYNNEIILKKGLSASYQNQTVNAIKLFFRKIENTKIEPQNIERPKRPKLLPNVLSKEEVKEILEVPKNLKHRAMLSLIYSCGLRRSELLNLKPTDIDSKRNIIIVRQAKGCKDRIAPLSIKIIGMLREYYKLYKPKTWLFEGQEAGTPYDERSIANVLKQALAKTNIKKPVSLHWLRHSYATHLLETGTDLRYIQEILGHKSSRTTEIYTHVSTKSIQNIKSPFDDL